MAQAETAVLEKDIDAARKHLKREDYLALAPGEFRAFFRQRIHLSLDKNLYWSIYNDRELNSRTTETARDLVSIWKERGLPLDEPDYLWAVEALENAENWINKGIKPDFSKYEPYHLTESEIAAFDHVIRERRSVRLWSDRKVSDETIDILLRAGTWAANSCNQQTIRYIVVREENSPHLIPVNTSAPAPVHILILFDERNYHANSVMPIKNRLLDVGAVTQNILLTAHAHGLAGVWLTHSDQQVKAISEHLKLEEWFKFITYVNVGYPIISPPPVRRLDLKDTVLQRI
jgi:nitroreductase